MDSQWTDEDQYEIGEVGEYQLQPIVESLSKPTSPSLLDTYLFSDDGNSEMDAITQLQREHDAYVAVEAERHQSEVRGLHARHHAEVSGLHSELEAMQARHESSAAQQNLQREVERNLAAMRSQIEASVRAEVEAERQKEREECECQFKEAMTKEVERVSKAIQEEATSQMQDQLRNMRAEVEAQVRGELQTETERKVRLALVQQMRPQVRAELESALRLEIRTAYSQEIRKEVEAALIPELEKRIASEYKAKHQRTQSAQKEQVEAALQAQLSVAKKDLEERIRRDAEAKVARKMAKQTESEVRIRVERMRQEVKVECEGEARKLVEASLSQIKQERAEIARLRSVENIRRSREDAAHKDAEAEFHKKVAEFRKHVQEEEARIARMKAVVQWRDEHLRRPPPSFSAATPAHNPSLAAPTQHSTTPTAHSPTPHTPNPLLTSPSPPAPSYDTAPTPARNTSPRHTTPASAPLQTDNPTVSSKTPEITATHPQFRTTTPSPTPNVAQTNRTVSPTHDNPNNELQQPKKSYNSKPPSGVAFDFTFDVKLIAAKLISDAREYIQPQDVKVITEVLDSPPDLVTAPTYHQSTPTRLTSRVPSPSPSRASTPATPAVSLGHIATEQRAQREFESQPFIPPQGALGARLRVLLPRLYQLWDESEISHVYRLDFCSAIRSMDVSSAERRVAMEISRLRKTFPSIQKEMALVARRESIKAQLARDDVVLGEGGKKERGLGAAERGQLQAELRRITTATHAAIVAWEAVHNTTFMYRGFPYRTLLSTQ